MNITVIGLGYVGMVAAACLADAGHRVLGVDIDSDRIAQLRSGTLPYYEPGLQELFVSALGEGRLRFEHRDLVAEPLGEVTLVATGTPQTLNGAADLSQVRSAISWIRSQGHADTVVV